MIKKWEEFTIIVDWSYLIKNEIKYLFDLNWIKLGYNLNLYYFNWIELLLL